MSHFGRHARARGDAPRRRRRGHRPGAGGRRAGRWGSLPGMADRLPHVPAVRGDLRAGDHGRRRRGDRDPRRRRRRLQPRLRVPEGRRRCASCTRTPTACARRSSASPAATCAPRRGTRRSPRSTAGCRRSRPSTAATPSPPTSATPAPTTCARCSTAASLLKALQTRNLFSASTVDQYPKQMASALMFGSGATVAVPDLDRTDHLLILGANPLASNGSLLTAPDMRGRLRAIRARGGKVVVIDPRRTRTAREADEHLFIRPGTDALLLFALVHTLFDEGLADPRAARGARRRARRRSARCAGEFTPEDVAATCGIAAPEIRRMARELAAAPTRRGLRADRHDDAALRHDRELARRRAQRPHRQPRPPRRRDVPAHRGRLVEHRRRARARPRRAPSGAGTAACAGWARSSASCRRRAWPRRSRRPARARSARC